MADSSNFSASYRVDDERLRPLLRAIVDNVAAGNYYSEEDEAGEPWVSLGANEVWLGSVDKVTAAFQHLVEQGIDLCLHCAVQVKRDQRDLYWVDLDGDASCEHNGTLGHDAEHINVADFPWWVNDEPAYEWLGSVEIHVPGAGDFAGSCDADGTPVENGPDIAEMVLAATDLDALKDEIRKRTGHDVLAAWAALRRL